MKNESYRKCLYEFFDNQAQEITSPASPFYGEYKIDDEDAARLIAKQLIEKRETIEAFVEDLSDEILMKFVGTESFKDKTYNEIIQETLLSLFKKYLENDLEDMLDYYAFDAFPREYESSKKRDLGDTRFPQYL
jgi:hypothetical protein